MTCSKPAIGLLVFLSLAANVFFAGMLVGKQVYAGAGEGKIGILISAFKDLSPESRGKAIDVAQKDWPALQAQITELRKQRDAVKAVLMQPDYKQEDLDKAFADVRTAVDKTMAAGQGMVGDIAGTMTKEERLKLISSLQKTPGL